MALMVVAIALPALLKTLYQQVDATAYLRDKTMGQWVASNLLAEVRIEQSRTNQFFRGERTGVEPMAERDWYWWMTSEPTQQKDFYRLNIAVAAEETERDSPVYSITAFVHATNVSGVAR